MPVSVSCSVCNKASQTGWPKTTELFDLTVLGDEGGV